MSAPDGQVAVITGAAGDIGCAITGRLLEMGARVALLDVDRDKLAAAARPHPVDRILPLGCDIADELSVAEAVAAVSARFGRIDVLVNNAATVTPGVKLAELSLEDWRHTFDVNLTGAFLMCRAVLPVMAAQGAGVVVNIASQHGHVASVGRSAYAASKAGLIAMARAIAIEHAQDGIRAVSISPGAILTTRLLDRFGNPEDVVAALGGRYPAGRLGTPEDVANAVVFVAGPGAAFINGTDLLVDGAYTAW